MTKIIKAKVENILGAKSIEIEPKGENLTIGGANGQGKSSAISALIMALGGKGQVPKEPVRKGAEQGEIVVELDEYIVMLEVQPDRSSRLRVESREGKNFKSPQKVLDDLFGDLSFDPGAFREADAAQRVKILLGLIGVDLESFEVRRRGYYDTRTDINRRHSQLEGKLKLTPKHADVPEQPVQIEELVKIQNAAKDAELAKARLSDRVAGHERESREALAQIDKLMARVTELKDLAQRHLDARDAVQAELDAFVLIVPVGADEVQAQIANASEINRKVLENQQRAGLIAEFKQLGAESEELTKKIDAIAEEKRVALAGAKLPLEGLGVEDGGVTFGGVPFEQISESQQWEVSTAIGFALNPKGVVFMRHSGGLDKKSRQRIRERAAALGVQLILEVVDDAEDVQVLIEEGKVKEDRTR